MYLSSSSEERVFEFQRHHIPHLLTIYNVESTHYENKAASLVHCNIIYIYISYVRLPLRWHLPCRILSVERQISLVFSNVCQCLLWYLFYMHVPLRCSYKIRKGFELWCYWSCAQKLAKEKTSLGMYLKIVHECYV